jgi:hypothetical protein
MLLTEIQIKQALEKAKTAFPKLTDWEFNNEENGEYFGFSMWGKFVIDPETTMPKSFFITLDTYEQSWSGHFTTGQHYIRGRGRGEYHRLSCPNPESKG